MPEIYAVRVQVLDPEGRPLAGTWVRASAGNEPASLRPLAGEEGPLIRTSLADLVDPAAGGHTGQDDGDLLLLDRVLEVGGEAAVDLMGDLPHPEAAAAQTGLWIMNTPGKRPFWILALLALVAGQVAAMPMTWQEHREAARAQQRYQLADSVSPVQHLEKALELARREGASPKDIGDLMDKLAAAYYLEDRTSDKQEALLLEAIRYKSQSLGDQAPELVPSLLQLHEVRFRQQRPLEAFELLARALTLQTRNFGPESAQAAEGYLYLGVAYQAVDDREQAERFLRRAAETLQKLPDPPDELLSLSLSSLASFLRDTGRKEEAKTISKRLEPVFARMAQKEREEAGAYKHLPQSPSPSDVVVLSPEETAAAVASAYAAVGKIPPPV